MPISRLVEEERTFKDSELPLSFVVAVLVRSGLKVYSYTIRITKEKKEATKIMTSLKSTEVMLVPFSSVIENRTRAMMDVSPNRRKMTAFDFGTLIANVSDQDRLLTFFSIGEKQRAISHAHRTSIITHQDGQIGFEHRSTTDKLL